MLRRMRGAAWLAVALTVWVTWLGLRLTQTLRALGEKHDAYGVTPEMYGWVGDALLATLAETAGEQWTPEAAAAWTEAYGTIVALMQSRG